MYLCKPALWLAYSPTSACRYAQKELDLQAQWRAARAELRAARSRQKYLRDELLATEVKLEEVRGNELAESDESLCAERTAQV